MGPDDPYWLYQEVLRLRELLRLVTAELERLAAHAEFALDNTLFRFGWRYDIAVVEPNQVLKFTGAV